MSGVDDLAGANRGVDRLCRAQHRIVTKVMSEKKIKTKSNFVFFQYNDYKEEIKFSSDFL